jgi:hypothetical protein
MTWIHVTVLHATHGPGAATTSDGWVNTDLLHAIEDRANGCSLIWHGSSPRTEWRVTDSIEDLLEEMGET